MSALQPVWIPAGHRAMSSNAPRKIDEQIKKARLPTGGEHPFTPRLSTNRNGEQVILKKAVQVGPKKGKRGYVDERGRIWIKDRSHADLPDHWDVQIDGGEEYIRANTEGNELP